MARKRARPKKSRPWQGLGDGRTCPRTRIECEDVGDTIVCDIRTDDRRARILGEMELARDHGGRLRVAFVSLREAGLARCGLGTRLYETALREACQRGLRLTSDRTRSDASEGFWRKQVAKGRARCVRPGGASRFIFDLETGESEIDGTWDCTQYEMVETCPAKIDLSGVRGLGDGARFAWGRVPVGRSRRRSTRSTQKRTRRS